MKEIWKPIIKYEGYYEVSNLGRIRSLDRTIICFDSEGYPKYCSFIKGKILRPRTSKSKGLETGYYRVMLNKNGYCKNFCIHKLVAEAFIPNPDNKSIVDHIDANISNNRVDNLRWVTQKENVANVNTREKLKKHIKHWYHGEPAYSVAIRVGISPKVYKNRIHLGWTVEEAIETPVGVKRKK